MLTIFSRLAAGEEMPAREKTRVRRGRPAAHRPRRARRYPRRATAFPHARRLHPRPGWQQAMLVLGAVISAVLLSAALVLNASGPKTCVRSTGTACASPSIPRHADTGVVALAARRSWFCCHQLFVVLLELERRRTGRAEMAAPGRACRPFGGRRIGLAAYVACSACGRSADAGPGG